MPTEPLVLLANADKWLTESLESVLTQGGYRVMATAKRQQVMDLARRFLPDGILLDTGLDQRANDNLALCRAPGHAARVRGISTSRRRAHEWRRRSPRAGVSPRRPHLRCGLSHGTNRVRGVRARDGRNGRGRTRATHHRRGLTQCCGAVAGG